MSKIHNMTDKTRKTIYVTRRKKCDKNLGPGWFRFQGKAGTKLPTKCLSMSRCGTYETGWLRGTHPSVAEGAVDRTVCFRYRSCCKYSVIILVRNCASYYVYHLINTPACTLGYCGTDWKRSELRRDYRIPFKIWFPLISLAFGSSREHFKKSYSVFTHNTPVVLLELDNFASSLEQHAPLSLSLSLH